MYPSLSFLEFRVIERGSQEIARVSKGKWPGLEMRAAAGGADNWKSGQQVTAVGALTSTSRHHMFYPDSQWNVWMTVANRLPVLKGTLDLLVLRALSWTPMHGF